MYDIATAWVDVIPSTYRNEVEATLALAEFAGPKQHVDNIHIDNAPELVAAAKGLSWCTDTSTPYISQTNGIVERQVGLIEEGARSILDR